MRSTCRKARQAGGCRLGGDTREKLGRLPFGSWHAWRLGEKLGAAPKRPAIFECVGVPGVISQIVDSAPSFSRVVVGVCVGPDTFTPAMAVNKELDLRFALAYTPLDFRDTLRCSPRARPTRGR
jgi:threonine dehydrogenase-like Zn-dependent dehydrogenase